MNGRLFAALRLLPAALAFSIVTQARAQQAKVPSDVLHDIVKGRLENPRWTPTQVEAALKPLLSGVATQEHAPAEEVALALAYFFTFDGLSAKPLFEKHQGRDDALGRVSWQSLQQMAFFGAKDYPLVEQRLKEFRAKFAPSAEDVEHTYNMVNNLSRLAATTGDHARAVTLVLEDIAPLPLDIPFRSFDLLAARYASFQAVGKSAEAVGWMKKHRDALRAAVAPAAASPAMTPAEALRLAHRPGVLHLTPFADHMYPDEPHWTRDGTIRYQRAAAIARLERNIAAAEKGEALPVP
jgi:hypothetical protein